MIAGLVLCFVISLALGLGAGTMLWPRADEDDAAKRATFRRDAIVTGLILAVFWPLLLIAAAL